MQASEGNDDNLVTTDQPTQSAVDLLWGFRVGDVVQLAQGFSKQQKSFALYCGQGRVIHAWTPSRQSYRVRVDSLRELESAGYSVTATHILDEFFLDLLNLTPLEPNQSIQRAKTALHAVVASRASNLSFILFARFGDHIFALLQSLKEAYRITLGAWAVATPENPDFSESPLDMPSRLTRRAGNAGNNNEFAAAPSTESTIKIFFGTNAELLMSEWLGRSLADFVVHPRKISEWYTIPMPAATNCLTPLSLLHDKNDGSFQLQCQIAHKLSERMAADRMECGICWMDFQTRRVMVMKCNHYLCDPCLQLLSRRKCPYCRAPIRFAHEISDMVKRQALRIMIQDALELKNKAALNIDDMNQEVLANNEPEPDN